jgi:hypothetical protein
LPAAKLAEREAVMTHLRQIVCTVVLLLAAPVMCWAQDGVINGRVTDGSGAALPGVTLSVTSTALLGGRTAVTDDQGGYRLALLPPGAYTVRYELAGFGTVVRERIDITAGFTATLNVVMEVGSLAETITVVGQSPIIDVTNAVVATTFTRSSPMSCPPGMTSSPCWR